MTDNVDIMEFFKRKYSFLTSTEIALLFKNNNNSSWEEWYEAIQAYADALGDDMERGLITSCGEECWREAYDDGMDVKTAFVEGFSE